MFPGIGTVVNMATVLLGTAIGVLVGHRLSQRTRTPWGVAPGSY